MAREELGAVLITGASSGIGRATALELDRKGFRVFAGIRKQEDRDSLRAEGSERLTPVKIDVAKPRSIAAAQRNIARKTGEEGLAGLVNNAGIGSGGPIEHLSMDAFRSVIEVNLTGQVAVTQAFLPLLRKGDRPGRVVFISSIGGRVAYPFMSPYHASKFGIEAVADSLRRELRPWRIRVIVIEPGSIATDIWDKATSEADEILAEMSPAAKRQYGQALDGFVEGIEETAGRGIPPERVAWVVRRALTRRFPDTRYRVGIDARASFVMSRLLGDRLFDRVVARVMRTPSKPPS
jgi:NAD(P)-dependent dehydrogenase (short-subunit alcohol dehydrogenase family)